MSTNIATHATHAAPAEQLDASGVVTFRRTLGSEWIKFKSLRSSWATLAAAVLVMVGLALVISYYTGRDFTGLAPEDAAPSAPMQGSIGAQLLIGILGVLFVSGEYATGMIHSSLIAVPRRGPVLAAKAAVFGAVTLVTMVASSFVAFLAAQLILSHFGHGNSLTDPDVLRVVIGTGVYLTLIGLLGGALGWVLRSTPGAITAFAGLILVLPGLLQVVPGTWGQTLAHYLPEQAGESFITSVHLDGALAPWTGLGVLVIWVMVATAAALITLKRRDG
ncbi:MAG TPA: ABC transporter permease [Nakamurella sp.]